MAQPEGAPPLTPTLVDCMERHLPDFAVPSLVPEAMRTILTAALIPAAGSALLLSTARTPAVLRATTTMMNVESWYDQGSRLSVDQGSQLVVESWYDNGMRINLPAGISASAAAASPQLVKKALAYEADIAEMQARMDAFPKKEGTMVGACAAATP